LPRRGNLFFDGARPALSGTSRVCAKFREELLIEDAGEICVWRRRTFARGPSEPARSPSRPPELSCGRKFTATRTTLLNSARPSPRTTLPIHLDALRAHRAPPSRRTLKIRKTILEKLRPASEHASLPLLLLSPPRITAIGLSPFDPLRLRLCGVGCCSANSHPVIRSS